MSVWAKYKVFLFDIVSKRLRIFYCVFDFLDEYRYCHKPNRYNVVDKIGPGNIEDTSRCRLWNHHPAVLDVQPRLKIAFLILILKLLALSTNNSTRLRKITNHMTGNRWQEVTRIQKPCEWVRMGRFDTGDWYQVLKDQWKINYWHVNDTWN